MSGLPPLVQGLLQPEAYPHRPERVELLQTQMSFLFLTGQYVYKVKKPVNLGYLDYTSLEQRHFFCQQEVKLNRRLSPEMYLGVVNIVGRDGEFRIEQEGAPLEYAVKMLQLPQDRMLDSLLLRGEATVEMLQRVGDKVARFHGEAETSPAISTFGELATVIQNTEENFSQTELRVGLTLSQQTHHTIAAWTRSFIKQQAQLFQRRVQGGRIRDCHGDLHAAHICFANGLFIYDCIEFNDRFRYCDVASEIAFLAMDLDCYGRPGLSRAFLEAYLTQAGDQEALELLDFYRCYRAYVRGKVEGFKLADPHIPEEDKKRILIRARRYFDLSLLYTRGGPRPLLLIICGLMGTGKSTLALSLRDRLGATVFSSDEVRKELAQVPASEHRYVPPGEGIYSAEFTQRTYEELLRRATELLHQGGWVIIDASFRKKEERQRAQAWARHMGAEFRVVEVRCPEAVIRERLERRLLEESASDARWETYLALKGEFEPVDEIARRDHLIVDTSSQPLSEVTEAVARWLLEREG